MSLLLVGGLFLLTLVLAYQYLRRSYVRSINDPPEQKPQLLFGNLLQAGLLTGKVTFHEVMLDYQRRFGDTFLFWFGSNPCITFCTAEHAQAIFADRSTFDQSPLFLPNFDLLCPHGIFMPTGSKWKRHVRVMLPMFKRAKVMHHSDIIVDCIDRWTDRCLKDGHVHTDLFVHCGSLTMNIIGLLGFDYDFDQRNDASFKRALEDFNFNATVLMMIPWVPRWLIRLYLKMNWKYQRSRRVIREVIEKIVEQEQSNPTRDETERPKNLIASLVSSLNEEANDEQVSSGLRREEMLDEVLVSILAGYETTSTALSWFIFYASKNPHVQQRIKEELQEHDLLATDDLASLPPLTHAKLDALVYCDCVVKETLRLAPVASVTTRMALHDTEIDGTPIRRGQTILIALNNINTDPRYWHHADPKQFVPQRFLAEDKDHNSHAMLPFGGGHRACIGQDLARVELKLIITRLMQRGVRFEDTPENIGGFEEQLTCYPKKLAVRVAFDRSELKAGSSPAQQ